MLLVDVGTNAEIVLGNRARVVAASSPTGPAFEGAEISSGQRAAPGAIERVRIDPDTLEPKYRVIGVDKWSDEDGFEDASWTTGVTGICGSAIIEVVAEMYLAGIISEDGVVDGSLAARSAAHHPNGRTFSYLLREGRQGEPRITVTQNDIRAIQLAKAALYAGVKLLMEKQGVDRRRHDPLRRRVRLLHRSEIRDGARSDPRLRPVGGEGGRQRRRHRRADGAAQPRPPPRDRAGGEEDREDRDGAGAEFPAALHRRHGAAQQGRSVPEACRAGEAAAAKDGRPKAKAAMPDPAAARARNVRPGALGIEPGQTGFPSSSTKPCWR